jgi:hypothetical protein
MIHTQTGLAVTEYGMELEEPGPELAELGRVNMALGLELAELGPVHVERGLELAELGPVHVERGLGLAVHGPAVTARGLAHVERGLGLAVHGPVLFQIPHSWMALQPGKVRMLKIPTQLHRSSCSTNNTIDIKNIKAPDLKSRGLFRLSKNLEKNEQ